MNWPEYVVLAETLARGQHEAAKRSAVSRAYYGTLNACRCWLETNVTSINKHRMHDHVWGTFETAGPSTHGGGEWELIADLGNRLRRLRNQADYDDRIPNLDQQAFEALNAANEVLELLAKLEPAG